ncbi:MAG: hypothetical protein RBS72_09935 [Sedimentisphaerales bacterium]|nr:hypothetical protein [Sedimentisphaerales bacterium]HNY77786.1 hypothetical protein [Sedimentisphaerales bacterium]HOC63165.1 hypothetical protein [Sedimentisphaerales bacterium]HOH63961.1 hypothetical protein [Sedimentisphaerales bacterium]HPY49387.1 hypothetical protein [Sedimentisphaerales bacterium]
MQCLSLWSLLVCLGLSASASVSPAGIPWEPVGLSGGGGMFSPAISPADPNLMMLNCDMSAAYISEDGGHHWRMIHHAQLRSDTRCRPAFHPHDPNIIYASSGGQLRVSRDRGRIFAPIGDLNDSLYGEIAINPSAVDVILAGMRNGRCRISRDAGVTWAACEGPQGQVIGFHFDRTNKGRILFAATDQGIWRSDDAGQTWATKTDGLPSTSIQGFAGGSNEAEGRIVLYCTVPSKDEGGVFTGGVFRSMDRGDTWQSAMGEGINAGTKQVDQWAYGPIAQYRQVLTTDADPRTVYALNTSTGFHPPHHETVYRSDDAGRTWRATYFQDPRFRQYNVAPNYVTASVGQSLKGGGTPFGAAICNSDPNRLILVWSESYITHDGGDSWFNGDTYVAPGHEAEPGCAWACTGLVVTTTWNYYIDPFEANRHYIAYTDIGYARSLDTGKTWIWWDKNTWAPWRNTCYEIAFDPEAPGKMWGAFSDVHDIPNDNIISERHGHNRPGGVCVSRDFGASWQAEAQGIPPRPVTSIVLDSKSPKGRRTLYAGVFDEGVYKSIDDGRTWTLKKTGLGDPKNMRVSRVILHGDGTLFAMVCARRPARGQPLMKEGVGLYRSTDGAQTWEKVNTSHLFLYPKDFSVHPTDSNVILLGACDADSQDRSGGLYGTQDGGRSWQRLGRQGRQTFGGYFHPRNEEWIYMTLTEGAPDAGLWLSRDHGRSWQAFDDLPFSNVQRVAFDPSDRRVMYVTTFGGSVWRGPVEPVE